MTTTRGGLVALLPLLATAMAPPAATSPSPAAFGPQWSVDWADDDCALVQAARASGESALRVVRTPGDAPTVVDIVNPAWRRSPAKHPERLVLTLEPGGRVEAETMFVREGELGPLLLLSVRDERFLTAFADARRLAVAADGSPIAEFALPVAAQAVAALRACEDDGMARWGIDPKSWHALRTHPIPLFKIRALVSPDDYPVEAMQADESGRAVVRLPIDTEGKPTGCVVVAGSGSLALDRRTCAVYLARARFAPATDAAGQRVAAVFIGKLTWRVW